MAFKNVKYLITTHDIKLLPQDEIPEVVFVGKSNVGKSSIINALTNNKKLAFVSSTPGKTKAFSLFEVKDSKEFRLVDIPGYGFSKVAKWNKEIFIKEYNDYFSRRSNVVLTIVLIDSRRDVSDEDYDMLSMLKENEVPFMIIGTKIDKCNQSEKQKFINHMKNEFQTIPVLTSSETKENIALLEKSIIAFL